MSKRKQAPPSSPGGVFQEMCSLLMAPELDWARLCVLVPDLAKLDHTPQSKRHHAEGDVGVHTRMAIKELKALPQWSASPPERQLAALLATLFHDISKPEMTKIEDDGSITSKGHSGAGAKKARRILWAMEAPVGLREQVCAIAQWHQVPFFAGKQQDRQGVKRLSLSVDLSFLSLCARADALGRLTDPVSARAETLASIDAFDALAREEGVWDKPLPCAGAWERELWLEKPEGSIDPSYPLYERPAMTMVLMCGVAGSGKSHLARELGLPVEGFDLAREELALSHGEGEGSATRLAKESARERLRQGKSFVFDITALSKDSRQVMLNLARDYGAQTVVAHCETAPDELWRRNAKRGERGLPKKALEGMIAKWSAPSQTEAGQVIFIKDGELQSVWGAPSQAEFEAWKSALRQSAQAPIPPAAPPRR